MSAIRYTYVYRIILSAELLDARTEGVERGVLGAYRVHSEALGAVWQRVQAK